MRNRYTNLGWLITILVAIIPVALWLAAMPSQWNTPKLIFDNIGRLAGLAGMSLFAWNVILSARLKIYNKLFMGLDNTYRAHHIIGSLAYILLLIHPVAIAYRYFLSSPMAAFEFLKPSFASPFSALGSITLFSMSALMLVTLYMNVKYERFVLAQRLLGLLLFFGAIHAIFVGSSDLGINSGLLALQAYIFGLIILAGVVYVYRSIFHGNFSKYYQYSLASVTSFGDIYELKLTPIGKPMAYLPGQFAFIKAEADGVLGQSHPFSMSGASTDTGEPAIKFGIKSLGDYTKLMAEAKVGLKIKVDGPYGTFSNKVILNRRQIWVAGGIGITPFVAMAEALDDSQRVDLYYSTKTAQEAAYLPKLKQIARFKTNLTIIPFTANTNGFLTADYIFKTSSDLTGAIFMICGPQLMMTNLKEQLKAMGVINKNINTEEFYLA